MAEIPYLAGGESIDAEQMNALFAELDRRTALALDNHSILYLLGTNRATTLANFAPYLGPIAGAWVNGPQLITGHWTGPITPTVNAARVRTFEQGELLFEGSVTALDFLATWNEFNKLRAHNCNAAPLTIRFLNSKGEVAHTLIVDPYSSKCVRRTGVDGEYTEGYRYFQKFIKGDPRFYQATNGNGFGDNLINPSNAIPFVNHVLAGQPFTRGGLAVQFAAPTVMLDPHVRAPLPDDYAALYGDATAGGTLIGDVLHHRGEFIDVKSLAADLNHPTAARLSFDGYGSITNIPGLAVRQVGNDLQISAADLSGGQLHDFIALSTNLFCTGISSFLTSPVIDGTQWFTLDRHMPPGIPGVTLATVPRRLLSDHVLNIHSNTTARGYGRFTGVGNIGYTIPQTDLFEITVPQQFLSFGAASNLQNLQHRDTLQAAQDTATFASNPAANTNSSFTSTAFELTGSGLVLKTIQTIPLVAPFTDANFSSGADPAGLSGEEALSYYLASNRLPILAANLRQHISLEGNNLVIKRAIVFPGYGFPDTDNWRYTGFFTPRTTRVYSDRPVTLQGGALVFSGSHPDFTEGSPTGDEIVYNGDAAAFIETEIALLTPWNSPNDQRDRTGDPTRHQIVGTLSNNDALLGAVLKHLEPAYWNAATGAPAPVDTNRKRCHANRIFYAAHPGDPNGAGYTHTPGGYDALDIFRFWRMEMAVEHYNNLAAKVNSMSRYKVLNWIDHGVLQNGNDQTGRYRLPANTSRGLMPSPTNYYDCLSGVPIRPRNQFTSFLPGSEDGLRDLYRAAGVPVSSLNDLPASFFAARAALQTKIRFHGDATVSNIVVEGDEPASGEKFGHCNVAINAAADAPVSTGQHLRPDLLAIAAHDWIAVEDMKAFAEARGYKFLHADFGVRLNLKQFDLPAPTPALLSGNPTPFTDLLGPVPTAPFTKPFEVTYQNRFFEFVNDGTGDWLTGGETPIVKTADEPYDIFRVAGAYNFEAIFRPAFNSILVPIVNKVDAPAELRRRFTYFFNRLEAPSACQVYYVFPQFALEFLNAQFNEAQSVYLIVTSSIAAPNVKLLETPFLYPGPDLPVPMSEYSIDAAMASTFGGDLFFKPRIRTDAKRVQLVTDFSQSY